MSTPGPVGDLVSPDPVVREADLRGHDPGLGWLPAVAHGADALGSFGRARCADPDRLLGVLAARLLAPVAEVLAGGASGPVPPAVGNALHTLRTLRTLRSLSLVLEPRLLVGGEPASGGHRHAVRRAVAAALALPTAWMWR